MKIGIIILIICIILISGCTQKEPQFTQTKEIEHFNYTKDNKTYTSVHYEEMDPAIEWIKQNTPKDAIFMNWWDYGPTIIGLAERETIVDGPSREILFTVAMYAAMSDEERENVECPDCNPHEKIMDVVNALVTEDPSETIDIMSKYDAEYLLIRQEDKSKSYAIFMISDKDHIEYINDNYEPTEKALDTVIIKAIHGEELEGFELVYSDDDVNIYRII